MSRQLKTLAWLAWLFVALPSCEGGGTRPAFDAGHGGLDADSPTTCWEQQLESAPLTRWDQIALHSSGDLLAAGSFTGELRLGDTTLQGRIDDGGPARSQFVTRVSGETGAFSWAIALDGNLAIESIAGDGESLVVGGRLSGPSASLAIESADVKGAFVARLSSQTGQVLSALALDVDGSAKTLAIIENDQVLVGGNYYSYARLGVEPLPTSLSNDIWVARVMLDDSPNVVWASRLGGSGSDGLLDLAVSPTGFAAAVGIYRNSGETENQAYIVRFDVDSGASQWDLRFGNNGAGFRPVEAVAAQIIGDAIVVLGETTVEIDFGGDPIPLGDEGQALWLGRYAEDDGAHLSSFKVADADRTPLLGADGVHDNLFWFMDPGELFIVDPASGDEAFRASASASQAGTVDMMRGRWFGASGLRLTCTASIVL